MVGWYKKASTSQQLNNVQRTTPEYITKQTMV
jgi:hypothetical protein